MKLFLSWCMQKSTWGWFGSHAKGSPRPLWPHLPAWERKGQYFGSPEICLESPAEEECSRHVNKKQIETLHHRSSFFASLPQLLGLFTCCECQWPLEFEDVSESDLALKTSGHGPPPVRFHCQLYFLFFHINRTIAIKMEAWRGPGHLANTFCLNDSRIYFSFSNEHQSLPCSSPTTGSWFWVLLPGKILWVCHLGLFLFLLDHISGSGVLCQKGTLCDWQPGFPSFWFSFFFFFSA